MGIEVGGYHETRDWPKMGPSLLIATCLIVAIRTARRPAFSDAIASDIDLEQEIQYAAYVSGRVFAALVAKFPAIFPSVKKAWYQATEEDQPQ